MEAALIVIALVLVVSGALIHASWNLLAKRSSGGALFGWAYSFSAAILYLPLATWATGTSRVEWTLATVLVVFASGVLHLGYSLALQRGYRRASLSVVYPVARGVGPALSVVGAIAFLGEHLACTTVVGTALVVSGVLLIGLSRRSDSSESVWAGLSWGALTGLFIASYTLNDGAVVRFLQLSPIIIDYFGNLVRLIALTPVAVRNHADLGQELRKSWKVILDVGALIPLPYILGLYAMRLAPISVIAPARELSMLAGVLLGWRLLKERHLAASLSGAAMIAAGVLALSAT